MTTVAAMSFFNKKKKERHVKKVVPWENSIEDSSGVSSLERGPSDYEESGDASPYTSEEKQKPSSYVSGKKHGLWRSLSVTRGSESYRRNIALSKFMTAVDQVSFPMHSSYPRQDIISLFCSGGSLGNPKG
jgi:hypothetical protein